MLHNMYAYINVFHMYIHVCIYIYISMVFLYNGWVKSPLLHSKSHHLGPSEDAADSVDDSQRQAVAAARLARQKVPGRRGLSSCSLRPSEDRSSLGGT